MSVLRTPEMFQKYADYRAQGGLDNGCRLCEAEPIKKFNFWKLTDNKFPFDRLAKTHHMLLPIRHALEADLKEEEKNELIEIKQILDNDYNFIIEATNKTKSIPTHFHLHFIVAKD